MRPILAFAILLLWMPRTAPEPDYSHYFNDDPHAPAGATSSLIEIESSTGRADRLALASLQHAISVETLKPPSSDADAGADSDAAAIPDADNTSAAAGDLSVNDLCNALYTSAQSNDLPVPFFANLIWQESRLRDDAVSRKGALGIAQFMPETAAETGLDNPLDPLKAIPASAHFLRELRLEFGNLGFVAAAYNAGARRVIEWLEHRGNLPRETRGYVVRVTGLSVDAWRNMAVNDDALTFVQHLPCRSLPAFASVEQAHAEEVALQQAKLEQLKIEEAKAVQAKLERAKVEKPAAKAGSKPHGRRAAEHKSRRGDHERREARSAHERHAVKREAEQHPHAAREKHRSV
ncbi:MAG: transglycosylase SLT domain-containing protein [Xanthobacteraceae bacterium]